MALHVAIVTGLSGRDLCLAVCVLVLQRTPSGGSYKYNLAKKQMFNLYIR